MDFGLQDGADDLFRRSALYAGSSSTFQQVPKMRLVMIDGFRRIFRPIAARFPYAGSNCAKSAARYPGPAEAVRRETDVGFLLGSSSGCVGSISRSGFRYAG